MRPILLAAALLAGCQSVSHPPIAEVDRVDLPRFMGKWYVIAATPTFIDADAHNAVETYQLSADGSIDTTYTFRSGGFDGQLKRYTPRGFVLDETSNARWGMQFVWPLKADYRISFLTPDYSQTVIGRQKRDYVWIMARTPSIADADYQRMLQFVAGQGYDLARIRKIPQRWDASAREERLEPR